MKKDSLNEIYEKYIIKYLNKNNFKFNLHDRLLIKPMELDFLDNNLKWSIEFNGSMFHRSNKINKKLTFKDYKVQNKYYHQNKLLFANMKDNRLLHIYEFEMKFKWQRDLIKKRIKNFVQPKDLNKDLNKVEIKERRFFEFAKNHHFWEYNLLKVNDNNIKNKYFALVDENNNIQLIYLKQDNIIKHIISAFNFKYSDLLDELIKFEKNKIIYSNLELGIYKNINYNLLTEPKYLNISLKNAHLLNKNDERILKNKYLKIYNSGYQIINT